MAQARGEVLYYAEIEHLVDSLHTFPMDEIGTYKWFNQHENLEKLNVQALYEVKMQTEETVADKISSCDKGSVLVSLLIAQEVWKDKVFSIIPKLMKLGSQAFPTYMVLYDAVTIASLLETLTYRESFCEVLDDAAVDLVDFCFRSIGNLLARAFAALPEVLTLELCRLPGRRRQVIPLRVFPRSYLWHELKRTGTERGQPSFEKEIRNCKTTDPHSPVNPSTQLLRQKNDIETILSAKAVGILSHLVQHANVLCLSAVTRMIDHHDLPTLLASLLENNPWALTKNGEVMKFVDGEWRAIEPDDQDKLTQIEGQLWITLHQVLLASEFRTRYHLNESRKNRLVRVRSLMDELVLDQLPVLADVQRYLATMSLVEAPVPKKSLIIEQTPVIRESILKQYKNRWDYLANFHVNVICTDVHLMKAIAGRMSEVYTMEKVDPVLPQPAKCACCGHPASRKCSSCKSEWYCRRECQVKQWPKHKEFCQSVAPESQLQ